jgi:hypothetical protein
VFLTTAPDPPNLSCGADVGDGIAESPLPARQLMAVGRYQPRRRRESTLVGRSDELNTIATLLEEAIDRSGRVVNISGPAPIESSHAD